MKKIIVSVVSVLSALFLMASVASAQFPGSPFGAKPASFGKVKTDIIPKTDSAYDLGTSALRWKAGYFDTITSDGWIGLGAAKGRIEFDDTTVDTVDIIDALVQIGDGTFSWGHTPIASGLGVEGILEVDGAAYFDSTATFAGTTYLNAITYVADDIPLRVGTSADFVIMHDLNASADEINVFQMIESDGSRVPIAVFSDASFLPNADTTFNDIVLPTVAIMSDDAGDYIGFQMGDDNVWNIISSDVTQTDTDETKFSHKFEVDINGVGYYFMLTQT